MKREVEEAQLSIQLEALREEMYRDVDTRIGEIRNLAEKGQLPEGFQLPREGLGYILDVRTLHVFTKQDRFSPGQKDIVKGWQKQEGLETLFLE